ncbi:hypothetical protein P7C70_g3537, partial [Phenoliferia sp. Uapishka_3]
MSTNYFEYYQQQTLSTPVSNGVEWFWETCDFSQLVISPPSSPEPIPAPGQGLYPTHHSSFTLPYLPTPPESPTNYSSFPLPNYLPLHRSSTPPPVAAQHNSYPQAQYTPYNPANAFLPPSPTLVPLNTPPPSSHLETSSLRNFERRDVDAVDADKNSLGVQGIPSTPTSTVTTLSDGLRISEITFPWNVTSPWYVGSPSILEWFLVVHMRPKPSQSRRAAALERERLAAEEDGGAVVRGRSLARTRRVVEVYRAMRR